MSNNQLVENSVEKDINFKQVTDLLFELQKFKSKRYGSSWCKHGEAISIFGNVSRKYDRLETMITDLINNGVQLPSPDSEESLAETIGDLANYCILWLLWIKKNRDSEFHSWSTRILRNKDA